MLRRLITGLLASTLMLAFWVQPAAADKPYEVHWEPFTYAVADCAPYGYDFWVWNTWEEWDLWHDRYDKDGNYSYFYNGAAVMVFTAVPDTGKSLTSKIQNLFLDLDPSDDIFEFRGPFQKVIVKGVGPVFMDIGRKVFRYTWNEDGTLSFELIFNAGPSSYTSNDFSSLCAALAP